MRVSSRHHYIPQFFIKNFADEEGYLFVYNKQENRVEHKKLSPKSIFFEVDRNTVNFTGQRLDALEKVYADLDNKFSSDLKTVLSTQILTPEAVTAISVLACILKWRVPGIDEKFNSLKGDLSQEYLNISITIKDGSEIADPKAIEHLENSDIFKETKRILLGILPFLNEKKLEEIYNSCFIHSTSVFPSVIGDCPVIEQANPDISTFENFILPISSSDTFIYKKGCKKQILNSLFFIQKDLAILNSSQKYIACKSREHLEKVVSIYSEIKSSNQVDKIEKYIFDYVA
jgi:Protein of unknown function (DUF4238)